jgi:hypothetical protein
MPARIKGQRVGGMFTIYGNREGLIEIAITCLQLALLPEDDAEARQLGNHYHFEPGLDQSTLDDSHSFEILYKPDL